jgi:hypothetical protein
MAYADPLDPRNREARRRHYAANKDQYLRRNAQKKAEIRNIIDTTKSVPCMDCGQRFPPCAMDFDHRDPTKKVATVASLLGSGSIKKVEEEMAKCDVICSNCHRIRTHMRLS